MEFKRNKFLNLFHFLIVLSSLNFLSKVNCQGVALQCNFESKDFCNWFPEPTNDLQWEIKNATNSVYGTAPLNDVTFQNSLGHYAIVAPKNTLDIAVLKSPQLTYTQETCLEFWYQLNGAEKSNLAVVMKNKVNSTFLWNRNGNLADTWSHAYVRVPENSTQNWIEFNGNLTNITSGYVAIDEVQLLISSCPTTQFCDFELPDICNYQNDKTGDFNWLRIRGATPSYFTGPKYDHTYQTEEGYYMYIEASNPQKKGDKARLLTPLIKKKASGVCLNFWYHAHGDGVGTFNIYTRINDKLSSNPIWTINDDQGDLWRNGAITVSETEDFQIAFEGVVDDYDGDISIDDIFIDTKGPCRPTGSCSFEDSLCLWYNDQTEYNSRFLRITSDQLEKINDIYEPSILIDTTTKTKFGHFLWLGARDLNKDKSARVVSETFFAKDFLNGSCLSFMYFMNGAPNKGRIIVYNQLKLTEKTSQLIIEGNKGNDWQQATIDLNSFGKDFELSIEASTSDGNIALDDLYLYPFNCSQIPTPDPDGFNCGDDGIIGFERVCNFIKDCKNGLDERDCGNCDFENSTCKWTDSGKSYLEWKRGQAGSSPFGPSVDNTLGTPYGYYMYINSSQNTYYRWATLKLDQILKPCSSTCELEFYYHMFGKTDDLLVYLIEGQSFTELIEFQGDSGDKWIRARIPLGRISTTFTIEFDGVRYFGKGDNDLAIDDIKLLNCEFPTPRPNGCPNDYFTCDRKACVNLNRICDLVDDCGDNSDEFNCDNYTRCDFENGLCDWKHENYVQLKWDWNSGSTFSDQTGPKRDHTIGTSEGHYVYLESSSQKKDYKARIISPVFVADPKCEFRFFYHMFGKDIGSLNIFSRSVNGEKLLFTKSKEVGDFWERKDIVVGEKMPFQIIIEGVIGTGYLGDLAIDDTSFNDFCVRDDAIIIPTVTSTPATTTIGPCGLNNFQCKSSAKLQCVPIEKVCDFNYDCDDKSDEDECGTCSFEKSWCGWYDNSDDEVIWSRKKAPSSNLNGPQVDHTTNSTGNYLITELSDDGSFIDTAILLGPKFPATASTCKMQFWVHMGGNYDSDIDIYYANYTDNSKYDYLTSIYGPIGKNWRKYEVTIGKRPANYQVEIYAYIEYNDYDDYGDIAIDDVEFLNCATNVFVLDQNLDCDFEDGFCNYYLDQTSDFDWERDYYHTDSTNTGPEFDHTTGHGYYAYIETSYPQKKGDKARFFSTIQTKDLNQPICLKFWYHMFGEDIDTLNVYLDTYDNSASTDFNRSLIWKKTKTQGNKWFEGQRTINSQKPWKVTFEGVVGKSYKGDIALDDLSTVKGVCSNIKICDFEADFCDYENDYVGDVPSMLIWKRGQPTLVSIDHTTSTNQGSFAYVDLKNSNPNANARLVSKAFAPHDNECLQFWYSLNSANDSKLNIYKKFSNNYGSPIWSRNSHELDYDNQWRFGQVTIGEKTNSYSIVFEAVKGDMQSIEYAGIDDINFKTGECKSSSINCDFEDNTICSWVQYKTDDLDWLLNSGEIDSWATGPHVDHTLGTDKGVYCYLESSYPAKNGDRALLGSDYLQPTNGACFGLYYFMHGEDIGDLYIYSNSTKFEIKTEFHINGEQGFKWIQLSLNISRQDEFRMIIEGMVGDGFNGDIAIDDITYSEGFCGTSPISTTTTSTTTSKPYTRPPITIPSTKQPVISSTPEKSTSTPDLIVCPSNYCYNSGVCSVVDDVFICNCTKDFIGKRCETRIKAKKEESSNFSDISLGLGIGIPGFIIIVALIYVIFKNRANYGGNSSIAFSELTNA